MGVVVRKCGLRRQAAGLIKLRQGDPGIEGGSLRKAREVPGVLSGIPRVDVAHGTTARAEWLLGLLTSEVVFSAPQSVGCACYLRFREPVLVTRLDNLDRRFAGFAGWDVERLQ